MRYGENFYIFCSSVVSSRPSGFQRRSQDRPKCAVSRWYLEGCGFVRGGLRWKSRTTR